MPMGKKKPKTNKNSDGLCYTDKSYEGKERVEKGV